MFHDLMDADFIFRKISLAKGGTHGYNSFVVMAMIILAYLGSERPLEIPIRF